MFSSCIRGKNTYNSLLLLHRTITPTHLSLYSTKEDAVGGRTDEKGGKTMRKTVLGVCVLLLACLSGCGKEASRKPDRNWPVATHHVTEEEMVVTIYNDHDTAHSGILVEVMEWEGKAVGFSVAGNAKTIMFSLKEEKHVTFEPVILRYKSMDRDTGRKFADIHSHEYELLVGEPPSEMHRLQASLRGGFTTTSGKLHWTREDGSLVFEEGETGRTWKRVNSPKVFIP